MATIFRQPGETGAKILNAAKTECDLLDKKCSSGIYCHRKRKMKLNVTIFCLFSGLCSSTFIDNAISMNHHKLDSYSAQIVSKYFKTKQDFANFEMINSKFKENPEKFHFNPISIQPKDLELWSNIETLHLYTKQDMKNWSNLNLEKFFRVEVHVPTSYKNAQDDFITLKSLLSKPQNRQGGYVIFNNIHVGADNDVIGDINGNGEFKFAYGIHTDIHREISGQFNVDVQLYKNDYNNDIRPVYVLRCIPDSYFAGYENLQSITIPNSVKYIGGAAFCSCSGLTSISLPHSINFIRDVAFYECTGLTSITIPNSVKSINNMVFKYCTALKSVEIPNSITSIGDSSFAYCNRLSVLMIHSSVVSIGEYAFCHCVDLKSLEIPSSVVTIGKKAFFGCTGLTSITVPNSVTSIGKIAFGECSNALINVYSDIVKRFIQDKCNIDCSRIRVIQVNDDSKN